MTTDKQIENWAHMLDEAFSGSNESPFRPKDENEKFVMERLFPGETYGEMTVEQTSKLFSEIWPNYWNYFCKEISKEPVEVEGQRRDVDDWDVWKISLNGVYGSDEDIEEKMFEIIGEDFFDGKERSLKEVVDQCIQILYDIAPEDCDLRTLEQNGTCIYRGRMHWGGYYPG